MKHIIAAIVATSSLFLLSACAVTGHASVSESDYFKITRDKWLVSVGDSTLRNDGNEVCAALGNTDGSGWGHALDVAASHGIEGNAGAGFVTIATATYCPDKTGQLQQVIAW